LNAGTFAGGELTEYTMGDRRRTEYRNTAQTRNAAGLFEPADPSPNVVIQRCDLGRSFDLNTKAQEYNSKEYPPKPMTPDERKERGWEDPDWDTSPLPVVRVETTTVDTGEREKMFGQWARHIRTEIKVTPLSDSKNKPSVFVTDGWYIDYDRRISCQPKPETETKSHAFSGMVISGRRVLTQRIENIEIGHREEGLLVKKGQNSWSTTLQGRMSKDSIDVNNDMAVTEFSEGPLDPALFEVPPGFKVVEKLPLY
jgi:hypothetical protein